MQTAFSTLKLESTFDAGRHFACLYDRVFVTLRRFMYGPDGKNNVPHRGWISIFERVLNEVKEAMARKGRADEFFGARVQFHYAFSS